MGRGIGDGGNTHHLKPLEYAEHSVGMTEIAVPTAECTIPVGVEIADGSLCTVGILIVTKIIEFGQQSPGL